MAGVRKLRVIKVGKETTAGTAKAATAILRFIGTLDDQRKIAFIEEDVGFASMVDHTAEVSQRGEIVMSGVATFEQLPYVFVAGIKTTTGAGAGTAKTWSWFFGTSAQTGTLQTFTIEAGDNQQAEEMAYCFVPNFTISGAADALLKVESTWQGRNPAPTTYTGSIAVPTVEAIPFNKGTLAIDAVGGTIGATVKSSTLISLSAAFNTGRVAKTTADGALYFAYVEDDGAEITIDLTFEHNTTAVAEIAAWRAQTPRQIRLEWQGTALTGAINKTFRIDAAGKWEKFTKIGESGGNDIVTGTFRSRNDPTAVLFCEIVIINGAATLT